MNLIKLNLAWFGNRCLSRFGLGLLVCVFLQLSFPVAAQSTDSTQKSETPSGALLKPAPNPGQWEISFSYPEARAAKTSASGTATPPPAYLLSRPQKIITTRTGDISHEETIDGQGKKYDQWHVGGVQYMKGDGATVWLQADAPSYGGQGKSSGYSPLPADGYRDVTLINADTYVGTFKSGNLDLLVFVPNCPATVDTSKPDVLAKALDSLTTYALVDSQTRRPVLVNMGGVIRTFHFDEPPGSKLALPTDLADQIQKANAARAALAQPAPRPY